jgi:hypothetical protein
VTHAPKGPMERLKPEERRRWRLITGPAADRHDEMQDGAGSGQGEGGEEEGGGSQGGKPSPLSPQDRQRDRCLELIYGTPNGYGYVQQGGEGTGMRGGGGSPAPYIPQWLKDLRAGFPRSVVEQVQREALKRAGWERLLLEPENLKALEQNDNLAAALLALKDLVPDETKALARTVVAAIVRRIEEELKLKLLRALSGRVSHSRVRRIGPATRIDWSRTIRRSLRHYQSDLETLVPDPVLFRDSDRRHFDDRHVILCVDQSGSMATSLIYATIMASVMASLKNLTTKLVLFDERVVDMSERLSDPVDVLFGAQLGGGTAIHKALDYARTLVVEPRRTLLVLISDLDDNAEASIFLTHLAKLRDAGVTSLCLLGLAPDGVPYYNHENASQVAALGIPAFAATPDRFVDVLRCVLDGHALSTVGVDVPRREGP